MGTDDDYKTVLRMPADLADAVRAIAKQRRASINGVLVEAIRYAVKHPNEWTTNATDQRRRRP